MNLQSLSRRDRRALLAGAILLAPVAFWRAVVTPYVGAVEEAASLLQRERTTLAGELRLLAGSAGDSAASRRGAERLNAVAPRLLDSRSDEAAAVALTAYLKERARSSRALLMQADALPPNKSTGGLIRISVQVSGESDLEGVLTFIQSLEGGPKLVRVDELAVESLAIADGSAGSPEVLSFSFVASAFALHDSAPGVLAAETGAPPRR